MPVSVSPRRHGVSRVLFGTDVAMPGSPAKPQSPRALAASQRSTYAPLPHKLSELKRVGRTSPPRGGVEGEGGADDTSDTAIVAARVVDRGLSPTSGRRRTAVGRCNVPSYVVAALAEGGTNAEVLYAPSSVNDTNRRQPPKFSTSTAPLTDREMGACTLPSSPLIVDLRTGSPVRGSISPRRPNMDASSHHPSSSPRHSTTRQLNASLTHQHGSVRRNEADDTLPVIGSTAHCASFFPDSSYFRSSKRGTPPSQQQQPSPSSSSSPRALPTGSHLSSQDRHGVQAVLGSPGRLIGSIQPQCPPPTLPYSIPHVPTRSGTNPIYPLEVTKGMVQADSQSAMYIPESGRMFRPTLVGYSEVEAAARDASIRRKWASGDKRAVAEAGLLLKKQQEATVKENNEHRRIEMKRYQKEYYEDRLQEYQRWEAKRIRLGHK